MIMEAIETYTHVLSVLWGTVVIIVCGKVLMSFFDRQQRDDKENKS
jgi:hypothetical protein